MTQKTLLLMEQRQTFKNTNVVRYKKTQTRKKNNQGRQRIVNDGEILRNRVQKN